MGKGLRMEYGLPPEAHEDCFRPPSIPTEVCCLHCQKTYESYLIEWRESVLPDGRARGFWCCPMPGCDGAGFGFDIYPTDPDYIDPDGRDLGEWVYDDEEAEDDWDGEIEIDEIDSDEADELPMLIDPQEYLTSSERPRHRMDRFMGPCDDDDIPF